MEVLGQQIVRRKLLVHVRVRLLLLYEVRSNFLSALPLHDCCAFLLRPINLIFQLHHSLKSRLFFVPSWPELVLENPVLMHMEGYFVICKILDTLACSEVLRQPQLEVTSHLLFENFVLLPNHIVFLELNHLIHLNALLNLVISFYSRLDKFHSFHHPGLLWLPETIALTTLSLDSSHNLLLIGLVDFVEDSELTTLGGFIFALIYIGGIKRLLVIN